MASSVELGDRLDGVIDRLVKVGRYNSRSEVLREGVRLVEEREAWLADLEASILRGIEDSKAGRVRDLDEVTARLTAKYQAMAKERETQ